jgi:molecular chaperone DnaK
MPQTVNLRVPAKHIRGAPMKLRGCESVGIDLGTTYSTLAYLDTQFQPRVISNASGQVATPSVIYFDDGGVVVGDLALQQSQVAADRVAQFVKVHMGDAHEMEFLGRRYTPESLSAIILRHLVQEAEPLIGEIRKAVITVPAYFTERRRRATEQAGRIAGLDVIGMLNEPMAATLAYGLYRSEGEQNVVVYDLGGGTFDVTVVHISPDAICELATCGNRRLGGRDWDRALFDFLADQFLQAQGSDLRDDPQAVQTLQIECERAKRNLSRVAQVSIRVFAENRSQVVQVTRQQFEQLTCRLVQSTRLTAEMALEDAGLNWGHISRVVLVGGSTQMPAVRAMLKELSGREPDTGVHPVTAVAMGAAIYAYQLEAGKAPTTIRQAQDSDEPDSAAVPAAEPSPPVVLTSGDIPPDVAPAAVGVVSPTGPEVDAAEMDWNEETDEPDEPGAPTPKVELPAVRFVTAHGVGVRTVSGGTWRNTVLIPKNSPVPTEVTRRFLTAAQGAGGSHIRIVVTQGDTTDIELAEVVGQGRIEGFPLGEPSGQPVDVIMHFDDTGRLHIRAVYSKTGQQLRMDLEIPNGLRPEEVERQRELLQNTPFLTVFRGDDGDDSAEDNLDEDDQNFILSAP